MKDPFYTKAEVYKLIFDHQLKGNSKIEPDIIKTVFGDVDNTEKEIPLYFLELEKPEEENANIQYKLGKILFPSQFDQFVDFYVFIDFKMKFPIFTSIKYVYTLFI